MSATKFVMRLRSLVCLSLVYTYTNWLATALAPAAAPASKAHAMTHLQQKTCRSQSGTSPQTLSSRHRHARATCIAIENSQVAQREYTGLGPASFHMLQIGGRTWQEARLAETLLQSLRQHRTLLQRSPGPLLRSTPTAPSAKSCRLPCCPGRAQCGRCICPGPPRGAQTTLQAGSRHLHAEVALTDDTTDDTAYRRTSARAPGEGWHPRRCQSILG